MLKFARTWTLAVAICVIAGVAHAQDDDASLYVPDEVFETINVKDVKARQSALMDQMLASIEPERPGIRDLYFIGVAGDAHQNVFWKEVRFVRNLFDTRFGTSGRSVALANNTETLEDVPLANVPNMAATMRHVGELLNPEEDMLFVFFTSHGTADHKFVLNFEPFRMRHMNKGVVTNLVNAAGNPWRIVVMSSCYGDGIVEGLKDERSVVIAAADAKRTSFGCSNTRDFTYFGQAYFQEQLSSQTNFIKAFEGATETISGWEAAARLTPSLPKIHVGEQIAPRLADLEDIATGQ